jgi:glycosyltransferase involved in cell wall biosynthesis
MDGRKFYVKGVTYGPFAPNEQGETFASPVQTARDFEQIRQLSANVLRLYYVPPKWFLDLAAEHALKLLIDIPWAKHLCFLDSARSREEARKNVREAITRARGHPAVFGYSVVNEIPAEIVRWSGVRRVERFIDELFDVARNVDPDCLYTFTSFPPTEFLHPRASDFVCFNVYLHQRPALEAYLARLQTLADSKPLLLGEFGMDSIREGESHKCEFLAWQIEAAFQSGLAGTVVFSYTDDWFRGGMQIEDWAFGLTTRERRPKESFHIVQQQYGRAPHFPLPEKKKVSVVVATYNGARTLKACLESLAQLNYGDYEVIVVDDGSTDSTAEVAKSFSRIRYIRQENRGLSAARNAGIAAATGDIVAFTDDDCRADEDWLYYLVGDLLRGGYVGIGGYNFLPPEDSYVAAAVAASPGGPAHVLLTDRIAEHIPGCNMAYHKWALDEISGFDPVFRKAGDDVDLCWRLQARAYTVGFSHSGFVWHYRRSTVKAYLKQQAGYGEAESLLAQKHPEYFNSFGQGIWRGRIYATGQSGVIVRPAVIYHGPFGSGFFQRVYAPDPALPLMLCGSLAYHVFVNLPLLFLSAYLDFLWPLAIVSLSLSVGVCVAAAVQAQLPAHKRRFWSRPLIALLFFLQPIVRGWNRFKWRLNLRVARTTSVQIEMASGAVAPACDIHSYWSGKHLDRYSFLHRLLATLEQRGWAVKPDTGWHTHDAEVLATPWTRIRLGTVGEELEHGRQNLHCRVYATWSFVAKSLFAAFILVEVVLISLFARHLPWLWMLPLTLYLLYWFFEEEKEISEQVIASLLDDEAARQQLVKLADVKP